MRSLSGMILFSAFLLIAAWQDLRSKTIHIWVYVFFGCLTIVQVIINEPQFLRLAASVLPGALLLLTGRISRGALGSGDGWFFVIAGGLLGIQKTVALLFFGILLCGIGAMGVYLSGILKGKNKGKETVPFLPFLVPVWLCMLIG